MIAAIVVRCNDCLGERTTVADTILDARDATRAAGWSHWRENGRAKDLCPDCHFRRYGHSGAA